MGSKNSKMYINKYGTECWENSKGQWHRLDGPAYKHINGTKWWRINDIYFSKEEFNSWIKRIQKCV